MLARTPAPAVPLLLLFAVTVLIGWPQVGCAHRATEPEREVPSAGVASGQEQKDAHAAHASGAESKGPLAALASLPEPARRELETVLSDEFCYCGCPHTLGACLKEHSGCKHGQRMFRLAAAQSLQGVPAVETIVSLQRYYAGFRDPRAALEVDPRQCRGPKNAPVQVVEFSDFECPYCGAARPMLEAFAAAHEKDVRFCVVPFPIVSHPNAIPAGQAALHAREKGRFWEMHEALFEHQLELSPAKIVELGESVGLNAAELETVLQSEQYVEELRTNLELGRKAGLTATPTVYFNGRQLTLPLSSAVLTHTLEDELEWRAHDGAWQAD